MRTTQRREKGLPLAVVRIAIILVPSLFLCGQLFLFADRLLSITAIIHNHDAFHIPQYGHPHPFSSISMFYFFRSVEGPLLSPSLERLASVVFHHENKNGSDYNKLVEQPITNITAEAERCARYHWEFDTNRTTRRRVFWGANVADDSWHTIFMSALEYRGLLSGVAFIESNRSQSLAVRSLRYPPGSDRRRIFESKELWGETTVAEIDYYFDPPSVLNGTTSKMLLARENRQRNVVFSVFARQGMTIDDIAIVSDPDEIMTRDFMYALKTCRIPEFEQRPPPTHHDCMAPKVSASTIVMESTPFCLTTNRKWWHPDVIIGECVQGIGDIDLHPPANRTYYQTYYQRTKGWADHIPPGKLGPLWDATDFRQQINKPATSLAEGRLGDGTKLHTAFHFHNYFDSLATVRNKYLTYGHPDKNAKIKPLHEMNDDLGLLVDCLTGERVSASHWTSYQSYTTLPQQYIPVALQLLPNYAHQRHAEWSEELRLDQEYIANQTKQK